MKKTIIGVMLCFLFIVFVIGYKPLAEHLIKEDFCKDNPNKNLISSSDYNKYSRLGLRGNIYINISETINCNKYNRLTHK